MSRKTRKRFYRSEGLKAKRAAMNAAIQNPATGQGGLEDRGLGEQPVVNFQQNPFVYGNDPVRASQWAWVLYAGDWAAQKLADIPVWDMYREGWDLRYKGDRPNGADIEKAIRDYEDKIDLVNAFQRANRLERIFGGAVIVIGVAGSAGDDASTPLTPDMVDKGGLRFLNVISRNYVQRVEWDFDPASPTYGRPSHYNIRGTIFHRSRLVIFDHNPLSPYPGYDFMTDMSNWDGMGLSVYGPLWDQIIRVNSFQQGAAHLAQSANVWIASKKGVGDLNASRFGSKAISELQRMVESLSMYRGYVMDKEVDIKQLSASFQSIPELIMTGYQLIAAASDIPASRFFGSPPGGLSTDDRSGLENYYNNIAARQRLFLDKRLEQIEQLILNSVFGRGVISHTDIVREYKPLWNLSDAEKADIRSKDIQNVLSLEEGNLITRENAIDELMKRESLLVQPDVDDLETEEQMEQQRQQMLGAAQDGGVDPEAAVAMAQQEAGQEAENKKFVSIGGSVGQSEQGDANEACPVAENEDDDGNWITTENGKHIHFDKQGNIDQGYIGQEGLKSDVPESMPEEVRAQKAKENLMRLIAQKHENQTADRIQDTHIEENRPRTRQEHKQAIRDARETVRNFGLKHNREMMRIVGLVGNDLDSVGGSFGVEFSEEQKEYLRNHPEKRSVHIVHNHIYGDTFSVKDMRNLLEFDAIGYVEIEHLNGRTEKIGIGGGVVPDLITFDENTEIIEGNLSERYMQYADANGKLPFDKAILFIQDVCESIVAKYKWEYDNGIQI